MDRKPEMMLHAKISEHFEVIQRKAFTLETLAGIVCDYYGVTLEQIRRRNRKKAIAKARNSFFYLAVKNLGGEGRLSKKKIGEFIGGRDHTTVIHAEQSVQGWVDVGDPIKKDIEALQSIIDEQ